MSLYPLNCNMWDILDPMESVNILIPSEISSEAKQQALLQKAVLLVVRDVIAFGLLEYVFLAHSLNADTYLLSNHKL